MYTHWIAETLEMSRSCDLGKINENLSLVLCMVWCENDPIGILAVFLLCALHFVAFAFTIGSQWSFNWSTGSVVSRLLMLVGVA